MPPDAATWAGPGPHVEEGHGQALRAAVLGSSDIEHRGLSGGILRLALPRFFLFAVFGREARRPIPWVNERGAAIAFDIAWIFWGGDRPLVTAPVADLASALKG